MVANGPSRQLEQRSDMSELGELRKWSAHARNDAFDPKRKWSVQRGGPDKLTFAEGRRRVGNGRKLKTGPCIYCRLRAILNSRATRKKLCFFQLLDNSWDVDHGNIFYYARRDSSVWPLLLVIRY